MANQELTSDLLTFFKALADENRLKIVGLLAQQPYTVEKLAEVLGIGASTTSHHLSKLAAANLVTSRTDGHYYIYSLQSETLQKMSQHLLHEEEFMTLTENNADELFERKVVKAFVDKDGRITQFPAQEKKFIVLMNYVVKAFDYGIRYTEKEVNEILARFNPDTAQLRRSLVEYHLMEREGGGGAYWRPEPKKSETEPE